MQLFDGDLACSRRSDRGDGAKRCKKRKKGEGWIRGLGSSLFFSRSLTSRRTTHTNAWNRLTVTTVL